MIGASASLQVCTTVPGQSWATLPEPNKRKSSTSPRRIWDVMHGCIHCCVATTQMIQGLTDALNQFWDPWIRPVLVCPDNVDHASSNMEATLLQHTMSCPVTPLFYSPHLECDSCPDYWSSLECLCTIWSIKISRMIFQILRAWRCFLHSCEESICVSYTSCKPDLAMPTGTKPASAHCIVVIPVLVKWKSV